MKIMELFRSGRPTFSLEIFPPRTVEAGEALIDGLAGLMAHPPDFISVTCGTRESSAEETRFWSERVQSLFGLPVMAHVTCAGKNRAQIDALLDALAASKIQNILVLRGDPMKGESRFVPTPDGFAFASELIAHVRERQLPFCVAAACHPEIHPDSPSPEEDLRYLKTKVDAGADFLVTQACFEAETYRRLAARATEAEIRVPILPGFVTVSSAAQIESFAKRCALRVPTSLKHLFEDASSNVSDQGAHYTAQLVRKLIGCGAPGVHVFSLNRFHGLPTLARF